MLRILSLLLFLTSCSMGVIQSGGEDQYLYQTEKNYEASDLQDLSPKIVKVERRDPKVGKLSELFSPKQRPLKRVGIVIFETVIQPTRSGLAGDDKVYVSAQGKQLLTEKFLSIWEEGFGLMSSDFEIASSKEIMNSKAIGSHGSEVEDYIKSDRQSLDPDDIQYVKKGKSTDIQTLVNPRGMRDLSLLLVPATELMAGPKWSEHQKLFINDISKELNLDAVVIILSEVSWTRARQEKRSGEHIPEEMKVKITASTLIPFSSYQERLKTLKISDRPVVNLCYAAHTAEIKVPVTLKAPKSERNFQTIEKNILNPMFTTYRDLTMMTITSLMSEWRKSY